MIKTTLNGITHLDIMKLIEKLNQWLEIMGIIMGEWGMNFGGFSLFRHFPLRNIYKEMGSKTSKSNIECMHNFLFLTSLLS